MFDLYRSNNNKAVRALLSKDMQSGKNFSFKV